MTGLLQREHPEIFARIGVGCWKSGFRRTKALISLKRGKIGPRLLLKSNRKSSYTRFRLVPKSMTLKGHYALCFFFCLSELTVKIWMKIDLYCQRQRCSPMTLVSGNKVYADIRGGHWREGVKRQWGNRKHGFSRLSTVRLRQLWKSGQSYYTVIFSLLSPVHWRQNTWPLMTMNGLNINLHNIFTIRSASCWVLLLLIYCRLFLLCTWLAGSGV